MTLHFMALLLGGDDMRYTFVNSTDYRPDNLTSGVMYQLQAIHATKVHHYNDTLDMLIISKSSAMTTVRVSLKCLTASILS